MTSGTRRPLWASRGSIRKGHFRSIGTCEHFIHTGTILARFALNPRRGSGESRAAPDGIDEELGTGRGPKSRTQFRLPKLVIMDSDRLRRFSVSILDEGGRLGLKCLLLSYFRVGDHPLMTKEEGFVQLTDATWTLRGACKVSFH